MSGTYTQEKCGEDSTPLSNAPEARCGLQSRIRRSAGHIFSLLREKIWKKRALERFYSAYAPEKACRSVLRFVVALSVVRTPFGRAAEFLPSKILLRQIFVPAKSKSICPESVQRLSGFSRFCSAVSIGCGRETSQAKKPPPPGVSFTRKVIHMWMWTVYKFSVHNCATDVSQNCLWTDLISAHICLWTNNR